MNKQIIKNTNSTNNVSNVSKASNAGNAGNNSPAIFLDRDGVINKDFEYVYKIADFVFINDVFHSCRQFIQLGYKIIVITNQSGIARGYYSENDFNRLNQWMLEQFSLNNITITGTYYCPHHVEKGIGKYKLDCDCRKPKPGMILKAANEHQLDLSQSVLMGDNLSDIKAGISAGMRKNFLINTGKKLACDSEKIADKQFETLRLAAEYL